MSANKGFEWFTLKVLLLVHRSTTAESRLYNNGAMQPWASGTCKLQLSKWQSHCGRQPSLHYIFKSWQIRV